MDKTDELVVLEEQLALADAVTRAIAYGSPSPVEEHRASLNQRVLHLRAELEDDGSAIEDPAEEDDAHEDAPEDPAPAEPVEDSQPVNGGPTEPQTELDRSVDQAEAANPGEVDARGNVSDQKPDPEPNATEPLNPKPLGEPGAPQA